MSIIKKAEKQVTLLLTEKLPKSCVYHNLNHSRRVVKYTRELTLAEKVNADDIEIVETAAWFHDLGFIEGFEGHEKRSAQRAREFLQSENCEPGFIEKVESCILATSKTVEPENKLEQILADADCAHLGSKNFAEISELLREEWEQLKIKSFTDIEWAKENISFLTQQHKFYTEYALNKWQPVKEKNIAQLYKSLKKLKQEARKEKLKAEELKFKKQKASLPERGIETMFRVTLKNHITLSNIADTKANILLSVNAIIISLALSNLLPKLDNPSNEYLIVPTGIFVAFSLVSISLSVLATRPNVTRGKFSIKDVENKKVNLLFFGNFHKMKLEDFEWAMGEMMKDKDYLYKSMTKDLYFLGLVLNKKYKILRLTYGIFLIGLVVSVIAFAIAFRSIG